jgi:hypothetical protein
MDGIRVLAKKLRAFIGKEKYYVQGSGLIPIPMGQLNKIPKVIQEFHDVEAKRERLAATVRR